MFDVKPNGIYKIEEVAAGLDVCKATVYNMINIDGLPCTKIRGNTYVRGNDLISFMFGEQEKPKLKAVGSNS